MSSQYNAPNGEVFPIIYNNHDEVTIHNILKEPKVENYFNNFDWNLIKINNITFLSHIMFGPSLGFLFMNIDCVHRATGNKLPGTVFLRGDAVACLILIRNTNDNKIYHVKVKQTRIPMGTEIYEVCAGMVDGSLTKITGKMVAEIKEETTIEVSNSGVFTGDSTTQFNYLEELGTMIPSAGGCDEKIRLFWYQVKMTTEEIEKLRGIETGEGHSDKSSCEFIKVEVEPFNIKNILATHDSKAICAFTYLISKYPEFMN